MPKLYLNIENLQLPDILPSGDSSNPPRESTFAYFVHFSLLQKRVQFSDSSPSGDVSGGPNEEEGEVESVDVDSSSDSPAPVDSPPPASSSYYVITSSKTPARAPTPTMGGHIPLKHSSIIYPSSKTFGLRFSLYRGPRNQLLQDDSSSEPADDPHSHSHHRRPPRPKNKLTGFLGRVFRKKKRDVGGSADDDERDGRLILGECLCGDRGDVQVEVSDGDIGEDIWIKKQILFLKQTANQEEEEGEEEEKEGEGEGEEQVSVRDEESNSSATVASDASVVVEEEEEEEEERIGEAGEEENRRKEPSSSSDVIATLSIRYLISYSACIHRPFQHCEIGYPCCSLSVFSEDPSTTHHEAILSHLPPDNSGKSQSPTLRKMTRLSEGEIEDPRFCGCHLCHIDPQISPIKSKHEFQRGTTTTTAEKEEGGEGEEPPSELSYVRVKCLRCLVEQPFAERCVSCEFQFAEVSCLLCHDFFQDGTRHCHECRLCVPVDDVRSHPCFPFTCSTSDFVVAMKELLESVESVRRSRRRSKKQGDLLGFRYAEFFSSAPKTLVDAKRILHSWKSFWPRTTLASLENLVWDLHALDETFVQARYDRELCSLLAIAQRAQVLLEDVLISNRNLIERELFLEKNRTQFSDRICRLSIYDRRWKDQQGGGTARGDRVRQMDPTTTQRNGSAAVGSGGRPAVVTAGRRMNWNLANALNEPSLVPFFQELKEISDLGSLLSPSIRKSFKRMVRSFRRQGRREDVSTFFGRKHIQLFELVLARIVLFVYVDRKNVARFPEHEAYALERKVTLAFAEHCGNLSESAVYIIWLKILFENFKITSLYIGFLQKWISKFEAVCHSEQSNLAAAEGSPRKGHRRKSSAPTKKQIAAASRKPPSLRVGRRSIHKGRRQQGVRSDSVSGSAGDAFTSVGVRELAAHACQKCRKALISALRCDVRRFSTICGLLARLAQLQVLFPLSDSRQRKFDFGRFLITDVIRSAQYFSFVVATAALDSSFDDPFNGLGGLPTVGELVMSGGENLPLPDGLKKYADVLDRIALMYRDFSREGIENSLQKFGISFMRQFCGDLVRPVSIYIRRLVVLLQRHRSQVSLALLQGIIPVLLDLQKYHRKYCIQTEDQSVNLYRAFSEIIRQSIRGWLRDQQLRWARKALLLGDREIVRESRDFGSLVASPSTFSFSVVTCLEIVLNPVETIFEIDALSREDEGTAHKSFLLDYFAVATDILGFFASECQKKLDVELEKHQRRKNKSSCDSSAFSSLKVGASYASNIHELVMGVSKALFDRSFAEIIATTGMNGVDSDETSTGDQLSDDDDSDDLSDDSDDDGLPDYRLRIMEIPEIQRMISSTVDIRNDAYRSLAAVLYLDCERVVYGLLSEKSPQETAFLFRDFGRAVNVRLNIYCRNLYPKLFSLVVECSYALFILRAIDKILSKPQKLYRVCRKFVKLVTDMFSVGADDSVLFRHRSLFNKVCSFLDVSGSELMSLYETQAAQKTQTKMSYWYLRVLLSVGNRDEKRFARSKLKRVTTPKDMLKLVDC